VPELLVAAAGGAFFLDFEGPSATVPEPDDGAIEGAIEGTGVEGV